MQNSSLYSLNSIQHSSRVRESAWNPLDSVSSADGEETRLKRFVWSERERFVEETGARDGVWELCSWINDHNDRQSSISQCPAVSRIVELARRALSARTIRKQFGPFDHTEMVEINHSKRMVGWISSINRLLSPSSSISGRVVLNSFLDQKFSPRFLASNLEVANNLRILSRWFS